MPFLPPNQQRQSTEGMSEPTTKKVENKKLKSKKRVCSEVSVNSPGVSPGEEHHIWHVSQSWRAELQYMYVPASDPAARSTGQSTKQQQLLSTTQLHHCQQRNGYQPCSRCSKRGFTRHSHRTELNSAQLQLWTCVFQWQCSHWKSANWTAVWWLWTLLENSMTTAESKHLKPRSAIERLQWTM